MKKENMNSYSKTEVEDLIEELKYEQTKVRKYFDVAGVMLMVLDGKGNINLINKKGCDILEAKEEDLIGLNFLEYFLPIETKANVQNNLKRLFDSESEMFSDFENEIVTPSGKIKIIIWHNTVLKDLKGNNFEILSSGEDITSLKFKEKALIESNLRFQTLFEKAPLGYQSLDVNGNIREINQTWTTLLGYKKEDVIGKWFGSFLTPEYQDSFIKRFEFFKQQGKIHSEFNMICKDGSIKYIAFDGMIGYDDNHNFVQTYCNLNDITSRHKTQMKLKESEENLKLAQAISKTGSWELNIEKNCLHLSEETLNIYDLEYTEENIKLSEIKEFIDPQDIEKFEKCLDTLIHKNIPCDITLKIRTKKDHVKFINAKASLFTDSQNIPLKVIGVVRDITIEKNKELELEYGNSHDYLTNLYNRRYYFEQFKILDEPTNYPLGIMMMDVNGLKIINDAFGHASGDEALKTIGNILKSVYDTNDIVSRIGGDEFAALLPNTSLEKLQGLKGKIANLVQGKNIKNIQLSLAIGYEIKNSIIEDVDELQRLAENRMYKHKTTVGSSIRSKAITAILETLTQKYDIEKKHSFQVSNLCKQIGKEMKLGGDELKELEQAGLYHDIGKISIPDAILNKPGKLTEEEFEIIKSHTEVGYQILRAADEYSDLATHALHHHERWDGNGYPGKLKGKDIPLYARIITVVDSYEAMTADRPYRAKLSEQYAISEIIRCSGTQFDPAIAKIFVQKVLKKRWTH
jgi:diguanylate cyclase (GGDEF)-like protein/PAS domain S-box-containing protein/putative nucleotidyltransferase with HDIG domain